MNELPNCPKCNSEYTYQDRELLVCPECGHEWSLSNSTGTEPSNEERVIKDANGNILKDGDNVTVIKDLKVKGANFTAKRGTAVRRISLVADNAGHIEGKVNGQRIVILTQFVKKSN